MAAPTSYAVSAKGLGAVGAFAIKLDPQLWSTNAGEIWDESYLIDTGGNASAANGLAPSWPQNLDRQQDPPGIAGGKAWHPPGDGLFFEKVKFGEFTYRNVLRTKFVDNSNDPNRPFIKFEYAQYDCLTTDSLQPAYGGVDVDHGSSECVQDPANPNGAVIISMAKTVRFTKPAYCVDEVNFYADVLLPFIFDSWIYDLMN